MSVRRTLKLLHLAGTAWFMIGVCYVLVLTLRQAGVNWWFIFSLSGHSALAAFLITSLYLFALFRGAGSRKAPAEHPLTASAYYMVFYYSSPFLGALAGGMAAGHLGRISQGLLTIALGTLATTFLVWIIIDPAIGLVEMMLPASRSERIGRRARAKARREESQRHRAQLLARARAVCESDRRLWHKLLRPQAEELALVLTDGQLARQTYGGLAARDRQDRVINIGIKAWQTGALGCMRQLHDMAIEIAGPAVAGPDATIIDYVSIWWDGIGDWRYQSLEDNIVSKCIV